MYKAFIVVGYINKCHLPLVSFPINFPLLHELTGKPVRQEWRVGLQNLENIVCVGSVIDWCNERSIIWVLVL